MVFAFCPNLGDEYEDCLLLPHLKDQATSANCKFCLTSLIEQHAQVYLSTELYSTEEALPKAKVDVTSVLKCFPLITDDKIVLAMAAWYTFLCVMDDAVEKLDNMMGLNQAIAKLQTAGEDAEEDSVPESYSRSCSGAFQRSIDEVRILAFTAAYISHTRALLPHDLHRGLLRASATVLEAMLSESKWRTQASIDEPTYLSIRCETIGMRPFFLLAHYNFDPESALKPLHPRLETAMSNLRTAVGLQNDLIGLERDLGEGELFNYVLRSRRPSVEKMGQRWQRAIALHNETIRSAIEAWKVLRRAGKAGEVECLECLLKFVERHFLWATSAVRYKPQQSDLLLPESVKNGRWTWIECDDDDSGRDIREDRQQWLRS